MDAKNKYAFFTLCEMSVHSRFLVQVKTRLLRSKIREYTLTERQASLYIINIRKNVTH